MSKSSRPLSSSPTSSAARLRRGSTSSTCASEANATGFGGGYRWGTPLPRVTPVPDLLSNTSGTSPNAIAANLQDCGDGGGGGGGDGDGSGVPDVNQWSPPATKRKSPRSPIGSSVAAVTSSSCPDLKGLAASTGTARRPSLRGIDSNGGGGSDGRRTPGTAGLARRRMLGGGGGGSGGSGNAVHYAAGDEPRRVLRQRVETLRRTSTPPSPPSSPAAAAPVAGDGGRASDFIRDVGSADGGGSFGGFGGVGGDGSRGIGGSSGIGSSRTGSGSGVSTAFGSSNGGIRQSTAAESTPPAWRDLASSPPPLLPKRMSELSLLGGPPGIQESRYFGAPAFAPPSPAAASAMDCAASTASEARPAKEGRSSSQEQQPSAAWSNGTATAEAFLSERGVSPARPTARQDAARPHSAPEGSMRLRSRSPPPLQHGVSETDRNVGLALLSGPPPSGWHGESEAAAAAARGGLEAGRTPMLTEDSAGGTYCLHTAKGRPCCIFKPADQEAG
ncbi:unnamed protein product, partial [Phaeothamnion confervicola]